MNRSKDLAKNTIIIFIGTLCTKLISFFLLPLYTGVLTTAEYGIVDLLNTIISLLSPIISLQMSQSLFRYLIDCRENNKEKKELISTCFFFIIFNCLIYLLVFILLSRFVNNEYKFFLAINLIASIFCDLFLQISRGLGENKEYSVAGVVTAITTIICNIIFLISFKMKVNGILIGTLMGYISSVIWLFFRLNLYKYISISCFKKSILKKLTKYSLPLVPNQLSWWIFNTSDRVIVSAIMGLSYTGLLSVSYKFSSAYITIYNIFNMSWTESMALHINDRDVETFFNKTFNLIFNLFLSAGILLISFMPFIFKVLVNDSYSYAKDLIPIAIIAAISQVIVGLVSAVYVSKNDTKAIANTAILAAAVNVFVHLILIKFIGLYAAVISTFVSYFIFAIYRTIDVSKKYIKVKFDFKRTMISITYLIIVLFVYYSNSIFFKIIIMITSVIYLLLFNKSSITALISILKSKLKKGENNDYLF